MREGEPGREGKGDGGRWRGEGDGGGERQAEK